MRKAGARRRLNRRQRVAQCSVLTMMITRRRAMLTMFGLAAATRSGSANVDGGFSALMKQVPELERQSGGRLGVAVLEADTGARAAYRGGERFAMCSTFKLAASAYVLARVDRGAERLDRRIAYTAADLLEYAPVTKAHVNEGGMTLADLCRAAITVSDNTAANLILGTYGGPAGLTSYLRSIGDGVTRLDRAEPALNEAKGGDPRDTTTPLAMVATMETLLVGSALKPASRDQLNAWLAATTTGDARLRAGIPKDWRIGDKTGTGGFGSTNDIAIVTPPGRNPILVAVYLTGTSKPQAEREAAIKEVGRLLAS